EPELARELATGIHDSRLDELQRISDEERVILAAGLPTRADPRPRISLAVFMPGRPRRCYSKGWLHSDEDPFFGPGDRTAGIVGDDPRIALAICYELSVPAHAEAALASVAGVYLASVAKTAAGVAAASTRLSELARRHAILALM